MIVYNLNVVRSIIPTEADPPLSVDADAELAFAVASKSFKMIAG
jgi:hypothetical protein